VNDEDSKLREFIITESAKNLPLDAALDMLAVKHGFQWNVVKGDVRLSSK